MGTALREAGQEALRWRGPTGAVGTVFVHAEALGGASLQGVALADRATGPLLHPDPGVLEVTLSEPVATNFTLATGPLAGWRCDLEAVRAPTSEGAPPRRRAGAIAWFEHQGWGVRVVVEGPDPTALLGAVLRGASLRAAWDAADLRRVGLSLAAGTDGPRRGLSLRFPGPWEGVGPRREGASARRIHWSVPAPSGRSGVLFVGVSCEAEHAASRSDLEAFGRVRGAEMRATCVEVAGPVDLLVAGAPSCLARTGIGLGGQPDQDRFFAVATFTCGEGPSAGTWSLSVSAPLDEDPLVAWRLLRSLVDSATASEVPSEELPARAPR